jgi:hypothetical protein
MVDHAGRNPAAMDDAMAAIGLMLFRRAASAATAMAAGTSLASIG